MTKRFLGVPAFLIFIVFSLSGVSVGLFSMAMGTVIRDIVGDSLSPGTQRLLEVPVIAWMGGFFLLGVLAAWFFEKSERLKGEVPGRSAGFIAICGLVMVLLLLVSFAKPLMENSGAMAQRVPHSSQSLFTPHEDGPNFELATQ